MISRTPIAALLSLAAVACLGSCQSMAEGELCFEGRAVVYDDAELRNVSNADDFEVDLEGYGGHLVLMTPLVDVLGGVDLREFGGEDTPEIVLGLRRRIVEVWRLCPYVEGSFRYGTDFDTGFDTMDYAGWTAGGGLLVDLTRRLFVNARVMYEETPVDSPGSNNDLTGIVGTVGLGIAF